MLVKVYWSLWVLLTLSALALFATGYLTIMAIVVYGFFAFGLTFMGMMGVLPLTITHPQAPRPIEPQREAEPTRAAAPAKALGVFKSA